MKDPIPSKSYFRIGEVASIVGVEPHVLRYWEREFRGVRPTKSAKGQRVYSRKDVEKLSRVRELLYEEGFTIAGAKKKLSGDVELKVAAPLAMAESAAIGNARSEASLSWRDALTELRSEISAFLDQLEAE